MKVNRRMKRRSVFGKLVFIGCIVLGTATAFVQSEELTVRSGSKTITIQSGTSDSGSRTITADDFAREMLDAHNDVRDRVGLPPLQWSGELAAYSQKWADSLIASNRTAHNSKSPYGENILSSGLGSTPATVVTEWASESRNYTYSTNTCNGDCGHYTQLVWSSTRKVGCAMAHNNRREIWVCSYDPAGNVRGEWPY
jgi:pathogenesis-related protein 1